jgi:hypothetical protein
LLAGFQIVCSERKSSDRRLTLALYHDDMRRIGIISADLFCQSLSGGNRYFEQEVGTAGIDEAAWPKWRAGALHPDMAEPHPG